MWEQIEVRGVTRKIGYKIREKVRASYNLFLTERAAIKVTFYDMIGNELGVKSYNNVLYADIQPLVEKDLKDYLNEERKILKSYNALPKKYLSLDN